MDKIEGQELSKDQLAEAEEISETEEAAIRKKARSTAVDDADAAHSEGAGATGSAPDFGQPENYTGIDDKGL